MPYDHLAQNVNAEIERFFKERLGRPELFGRLGDKVVVFEFISEPVGRQIFEKQLEQLIIKVREQRQIDLVMSDMARDKLAAYCVQDLASGGRGIGARLESGLVDPLAAALFQRERSQTVTVMDVDIAAGRVSLE